jgi:hypothetical protein
MTKLLFASFVFALSVSFCSTSAFAVDFTWTKNFSYLRSKSTTTADAMHHPNYSSDRDDGDSGIMTTSASATKYSSAAISSGTSAESLVAGAIAVNPSGLGVFNYTAISEHHVQTDIVSNQDFAHAEAIHENTIEGEWELTSTTYPTGSTNVDVSVEMSWGESRAGLLESPGEWDRDVDVTILIGGDAQIHVFKDSSTGNVKATFSSSSDYYDDESSDSLDDGAGSFAFSGGGVLAVGSVVSIEGETSAFIGGWGNGVTIVNGDFTITVEVTAAN